MSFENVKQYFENIDLGQRVIALANSSATVQEAAEAVGCQPMQIAKTLVKYSAFSGWIDVCKDWFINN